MFKKVLLLLFTCFAFSLVFAQEETNQNLGQNFKFYFYPVQNANASNLAEILSNISGNINQQTKASNKKKGKQLSISHLAIKRLIRLLFMPKWRSIALFFLR